MSELALKLIQENIEKHRRGEDATFLDLGNCGMTEVPEQIGECIWVEELSLCKKWFDWDDYRTCISKNSDEENDIIRLSNGFSNLVNLRKLWLNGDYGVGYKVKNIDLIENLILLESLCLRNVGIVSLEPLKRLINLRNLEIDTNKILDISPISTLINLQNLDIKNTQISDLGPLVNLTKLKYLFAVNSNISDLTPLSALKNLEELIIHRNPINSLSPIAKLPKLTNLTINATNISDIKPISSITSLSFLRVTGLQISDISCLNKIPKLRTIDISYTNVTDISPLIKFLNTKKIDVIWEDWGRDKGLFVLGCPLIIPPVEFAQKSPQAVRDYFEELGDDGQNLNEVKVIFLGEASAGKTSLVKSLLGEDFDSKESQTHGIRIRKVPFNLSDGDTVIAHLWDFGGQEVMHATHQFFLSQRCIYVLLLNSRNDDQAEKWLKHAASFGGNSPVLVVLNKIDENPSFEVNRKALLEKYPQIRAFFRLSAKTRNGIDAFREALCREIDLAPTRRTPFPAHWLEVKEHFSNMEADYIESSEYKKVCEESGVTNQFSQGVLLQFLHDLGVVINFRNLKYFDTQILNPIWLTNGVYRIINSELVADAGGLLRESDFDAVINDPRYKQGNTVDREFIYPTNKLRYIVRVMEEFELCFMLDPRVFVVPQLLPIQEPEFAPEGATLQFVIHFPDFLPDSLFPRLMVKLHTYISGDQRWRSGMVLHKPSVFQALARVRWDKEDQKIRIDACGEDRLRLLSFIRETVKEIVEDFTNLDYEEMVPIPETSEFFEYQYLVEAEKAGEKEVFVKQLKKRIPLTDLLNGVEEPAMRDEMEQLPVKAFVSYAHKDLEYLKEMRSALSPLIRLQKLQIWDDQHIDAGDDWEKVLFQQLEAADIVLCLVSSDFVASDFCYKKEFSAALAAHNKGDKTIIPVMLRDTDWKDLPLGRIQGAPGAWITSTSNRDEAWRKVSESLRPALEKAKMRKKAILDKRRKGSPEM